MKIRYISFAIALIFVLFARRLPVSAEGPSPLCDSPMPIADYPRPANDNGWGIHWGPGAASQDPAAVGFFAEQVDEMGIKWVKILNRGTDFAMDGVVDALTARKIMPVLRIQEQDMEALYPPDVRRLVQHYRLRGVPYYELYNEPNLLDEWPAGASIDIGRVADVWIPVAAAVQDTGGFPSTPALAPGGHWEDMDFFRTFLREVRRRAENGDKLAYQALCGKPGVWIANHNYGLNHYFDYPRDTVNMEPVMVTEAEKRWYGIDDTIVNGLNQTRNRADRPFYVGDSLMDDSNGFFKFYAQVEIFREEIGYTPPVIVTEGGWLYGDNQDPRYPPVNETYLTNETMRGYEYMLTEAPDFLLSWQPWILCNFACNGTDGRFEGHAWFKSRSEDDVLDIVNQLKASPGRAMTRLNGGNGLPGWVGESPASPAGTPVSPLVRTPTELLLDAALRLGRQTFQMIGGSDAIRILADPLAAANRFLVQNVTSRLATVDIAGQVITLSPYGDAVVEIRPRMESAEVGEAVPLTISEVYAGRMSVVRLPDEDEAAFQARLAFDGTVMTTTTAITAGGGVVGVELENPYPFGVAEYRRLSCDENRGMANLFIEVLNAAGQPMDGVKLLFNTADGKNPFNTFTGEKGPGKAEFALVSGVSHGGEWTIEVDSASGGSPRAVGLRTTLPDDPCPSRGNTTGHYSYKVVFQEGAGRGVPVERTPLQVVPEEWTFPRPRSLDGAVFSPKALSEWPRPEGDNGLGLHFLPVPQLNEYALDLFIYHLKELDMRWTTLYYDNPDILELAAPKFRDAGIMVIWRPALRPYDQYPARRAEQEIESLRMSGMPPYIQLYNEPTVGQEWEGNEADLGGYRRNFIDAADAVYQAGGYVGFQDVDVASLTALIQQIKGEGKDYLFSEAFFVPHCYGSNHPPAYPYDELNQADRGTTIETDYNASVLCFLKFAQVWQAEAGFVPPMIMGEGGWATSILEDGRYPRMTEETHREYHLAMFNWFKSGQLSNGDPLPDYLFAVTPWLISGAGAMQFEENGWFYSKLTGTKYETVEAVRAMPPFVRRFGWDN